MLRDMFTMVVKVVKRADKHCLRREVGIGSRSQNELEDLEIILETSSSLTWEKTLRFVGVCRGGV